MRKVGYALLLIGFAWICVLQVNGIPRAGLRPVVLAQYAKLSSDPSRTYNVDELRVRIVETAIATFGIFPHTLPPGLLMLVGGFLLAHRPRTPKVHNGA